MHRGAAPAFVRRNGLMGSREAFRPTSLTSKRHRNTWQTLRPPLPPPPQGLGLRLDLGLGVIEVVF